MRRSRYIHTHQELADLERAINQRLIGWLNLGRGPLIPVFARRGCRDTLQLLERLAGRKQGVA